MHLDVAVAKTRKYATPESGDTTEMIERPGGGLSFVVVDGQRSGRSAKAISNIVARKAVALLAEGIRDGAAARAAHDYLYTHRSGKVSATLNIVSVDLESRSLVLSRNSPAACALLALAGPGSGGRLLDLVRPIVGTARRDQRIGAANSGQAFPAVGVPFGMTHWTPQAQASEDKCVSPYYAQDERLQGVRASHFWSGSCTQDYGSATFAAVTGPLRLGAAERASAFSRVDEVMTPAYYAATLADHGVRVEVTGTARAGILRFTFLREGEAAILVHANGNRDTRPGQQHT